MSDVKATIGATDHVTVILKGDSADISAGGFGQQGNLFVKDGQDKDRIRMGFLSESAAPSTGKELSGSLGATAVPVAMYWGIRIDNVLGKRLVDIGWMAATLPQTVVDTPTAGSADVYVRLGGGADGCLVLEDSDGKQIIRLRASDGTIVAGGHGKHGSLQLRNDESKTLVQLETSGKVSSGQGYATGGSSLRLRNSDGEDRVLVDARADRADIALFSYRSGNLPKNRENAAMLLDGGEARLSIGGHNCDGMISVKRASGERNILITAEPFSASDSDARIWVGGNGAGSDIRLFPADAPQGPLNETIRLDGNSGDIMFRNADCAEEFDAAEELLSGTVVILDDEGRLRISDTPYDSRVAGVISGIGNDKPAIILGRRHPSGGRLPIALVGKVYCKVEADSAPVRPGTLLTTSNVPGHAMAAMDQHRAFGAVLGKALQAVERGRDLIPILVALQ